MARGGPQRALGATGEPAWMVRMVEEVAGATSPANSLRVAADREAVTRAVGRRVVLPALMRVAAMRLPEAGDVLRLEVADTHPVPAAGKKTDTGKDLK